jgi:hypothetical protein
VLDTEEESLPANPNTEIARYDVELIDLINADLLLANDKLTMTYKPRIDSKEPMKLWFCPMAQ